MKLVNMVYPLKAADLITSIQDLEFHFEVSPHKEELISGAHAINSSDELGMSLSINKVRLGFQ